MTKTRKWPQLSRPLTIFKPYIVPYSNMPEELSLEALFEYQKKMDSTLVEFQKRTPDLLQAEKEEGEKVSTNLVYDLYTLDDVLYMEIELPGVSEEDISVELTPKYLKIQGKPVERQFEKQPHYVVQNRRRGILNYMLHLPSENMDEHEIPVFKDGVLYLSFHMGPEGETVSETI